MRAIVLGATGMLGTYVYDYLRRQGHEVIGTTRCFGFDARQFRLSQLGAACKEWDTEPFTVINCIGAIKQKHTDFQTLWDVNAFFPIELAKFLSEFKHAQMLHFSTDCVFSGKKPYRGEFVSGYYELEPKDAEDDYGLSKAFGEQCVRHGKTHVIRTSIVGEDGLSQVSLLEWVKSQDGGTIHGYTNHWWQGVTCLEAAKFAEYKMGLFDHRIPANLQHVFCTIPVTKFQLIQHIIKVYNLNIELIPVEAETTVNRCLNSIIGYYRAPPILSQLYEQSFFRP